MYLTFLLIYRIDLVFSSVISRLEDSPTWEEAEISKALHEEMDSLKIKPKTFMTLLRHALSGMKVCSSLLYLGLTDTRARLDLRLPRLCMFSVKNVHFHDYATRLSRTVEAAQEI